MATQFAHVKRHLKHYKSIIFMEIYRNSLTVQKNIDMGWRYATFLPHMVSIYLDLKPNNTFIYTTSFSDCLYTQFEWKQDFQIEIKINKTVHIQLTSTHCKRIVLLFE